MSVTISDEPTAIPAGPITRKPDVGSVEPKTQISPDSAPLPKAVEKTEVKKTEPDDNASLFGSKKDAKAAS